MKIDKKNYVILFLYILILRYHYSLMLLSLTSRSRWHRRAWLRHFSTQCDSTVSIPLRSFFTSPLNRIIFIFGNTFSLWIRGPEGLESILFFFQFIRKFFLITKNLLKGAFQPRRWFGKILFSSVIMKHEFRIVYDFCFSSLRILRRSRWWWWWRSCDRAVTYLYIHIRESIHLGCAKETNSYVYRHIVFVADMFLLFFVVGLRILGILYGSFSVFSLILKTFW